MPKKEPRYPPNSVKRRVTVEALWKHLETTLSYKKFYYEAFLALQKTSDAKLEQVVAHPLFELCKDNLETKDLEQLLCDVVMYRSDNDDDCSTIVVAPPSSSRSKKKTKTKKNGAEKKKKDVDADANAAIAKDDSKVLVNRHRPWYQGYSQGFVDVCCQVLQLMMNSKANQSIINIQRSTFLALHDHVQGLQHHVRVVLKHIANNNNNIGKHHQDGKYDDAPSDTVAGLPIHNVDASYNVVVTLLLRPLKSFLTPPAYQVIHSILVSYDATKHQDVVLFGYCRGAIDVCTFVLKWTQLVVTQTIHAKKKQKKKKKQKTNDEFSNKTITAAQAAYNEALLKSDANWGSKQLLKHKVPVGTDATSTTDDDDDDDDGNNVKMGPTSVASIRPASSKNLLHPGAPLFGKNARASQNTTALRRVSCDGMGEKEEQKKKNNNNNSSNEASSSSSSQEVPLLQFTTRPSIIRDILSDHEDDDDGDDSDASGAQMATPRRLGGGGKTKAKHASNA